MNISEIAKLAGVSSAAVSRYFNNGYISEEKRAAIQKVVEETGYRPSVQAQTLRTRKTKMIGVIVPKISSPSTGKVVEGILSSLNENSYHMLLAVTQNDPKKELEYLEAFRARQVDGVIFIATVFSPEHRRALKKVKIPVVIVGQKMPGYCCVYHDDYQATYSLTKLFLEKGRNQLGYIGVTLQDKAAGEARYRGFRDAVWDAGRKELAENCVTATFSYESGYEMMKILLSKCPQLDGLICATDTIALGAVQYLKEIGTEIPAQVLAAGHGDSLMGRISEPRLITVHYSYEESGKMAVRMLLENLKDGEQAHREVMLGCSIVED